MILNHYWTCIIGGSWSNSFIIAMHIMVLEANSLTALSYEELFGEKS